MELFDLKIVILIVEELTQLIGRRPQGYAAPAHFRFLFVNCVGSLERRQPCTLLQPQL